MGILNDSDIDAGINDVPVRDTDIEIRVRIIGYSYANWALLDAPTLIKSIPKVLGSLKMSEFCKENIAWLLQHYITAQARKRFEWLPSDQYVETLRGVTCWCYFARRSNRCTRPYGIMVYWGPKEFDIPKSTDDQS